LLCPVRAPKYTGKGFSLSRGGETCDIYNNFFNTSTPGQRWTERRNAEITPEEER